MELHLSLRQRLLGSDTVAETFQRAKNLNVDALEWDVDTLYDTDPLWQPAGRRALIRQQELQELPVAVVSLGQLNRTGLAHPDEEVRRFAVRFAGEGIRHTAEVSRACVVLPFYGPAALEDAADMKRAVTAIGQVLRMAEEVGLALALAGNMPARELRQLLLHLDSPRIGIAYDVARAVLAGRDPAAELGELMDALRVVRLGDARTRVHDVPLGEGGVEIAPVLAQLHGRFQGCIAVEPGPAAQDMEAALGLVREGLQVPEATGA